MSSVLGQDFSHCTNHIHVTSVHIFQIVFKKFANEIIILHEMAHGQLMLEIFGIV